jgi:hypothetical protein
MTAATGGYEPVRNPKPAASQRRAYVPPDHPVVIGVECMNAFHKFCDVGRCDCRCHQESER